MKKTLIILLALGGFAMAEPTTDLLAPTYTGNHTNAYFTSSSSLITTGNNTIKFDTSVVPTDRDFALTFSIDLISKDDNKPTVTCGTNNNTAEGLSVVTTNSGAITLGSGSSILSDLKDKNGDTTTSGLTADSTHTYMLVFARYDSAGVITGDGTNQVGNIAYLFDLTTGDYIYKDGNIGSAVTGAVTLQNSSSRVWTNTGREQIYLGEVYALAGMKKTDIVALAPEPATATLSLLALAGLAARRRRK